MLSFLRKCAATVLATIGPSDRPRGCDLRQTTVGPRETEFLVLVVGSVIITAIDTP